MGMKEHVGKEAGPFLFSFIIARIEVNNNLHPDATQASLSLAHLLQGTDSMSYRLNFR
jgi:hypothetical protein